MHTTLANEHVRGAWPFPPVAPFNPREPAGAPAGQALAPHAGTSPLSGARLPSSAGDRSVGSTIAGESGRTSGDALTVKQMVGDVLLVAVWGAMIPGLMWLGNLAGF